jgi:hypothetical protein
MKRLLFLFASSLFTADPAFAAGMPIKPFHAEYATLRNGSELGRTTLDLRDNRDGSWTLRSETNGTQGLARLAGIRIVETSRFRWQDGRPQGLVYDYRQEGAFRPRARHADFDWNTGEVRVVEGDSRHRYAAVPGLIDRQSVTLAIGADLARGATAFDYKVAVKEQIEDMRYARGGSEKVTVPAGEFRTERMQRLGIAGADRKRVSRSWFAESLGWLPVMIEQTEKNGDTVVLKLVSVVKS